MNRDLDSSRPLLWWSMAGAVVLAILLVVLFGLVTGGDQAGAGERNGALVADGVVLVFRHTATDTTQTDADPTARGTCDQQRNLSADGLAQAERIGQAISDQAVTVDAVLASPFCRTVDTAAAFDLAEVAESDALISLTAVPDAADPDDVVAAGTALIEDHLGGNGVTIMVTHTQNIEAMTGELVDEGDAVVMTPADTGGGASAEVADVIPADAW